MDQATPNLPSRHFAATAAFYARLGFVETWRDAHWMILRSGGMILEFFPHPELKPEESWFSCCLRLDDLAAFYRGCLDAGIAEAEAGAPRLQPPRTVAPGVTMAVLIDVDGTLVRLIEE